MGVFWWTSESIGLMMLVSGNQEKKVSFGTEVAHIHTTTHIIGRVSLIAAASYYSTHGTL